MWRYYTQTKCRHISELLKTLPMYYTNIFPVKGGKPEYPINSKNSLLFNHDANYSLDSAKVWLDTLSQK